MKTNYKLCSILLISLLFLIIALSNVSAIEVDSFTNMQNNITAGEDIELKNNIIIKDSEVDEFKEGIVIDHNVTIDGKGYSVDGNHKVRLFKITNDDVVLTLINVTLKNGNVTNANGGAIYADKDVNLILKGTVKFNNNTASDGSVVENEGGGGAIHSSNNVNIISYGDVYFSNNSVYQGFGGAIFVKNNINMTINGNIKFNNNNATGNDYRTEQVENIPIGGSGGVIYSRGDFVIINCSGNVSFSYNNAIPLERTETNSGGAIYCNYGVNISANTVEFFNNNAFNGEGGAIYGYSVNIFANVVEFFNNIANNSLFGGGAIYGGSVNISSNIVKFFNNTATDNNGGAIYGYDGVNISSNIVEFFNNTATDNNGGAIFSMGSVNISSNIVKFFNNVAGSGSGGAILSMDSVNIFAINVSFFNNVAGSGSGGAISALNIWSSTYYDVIIINKGGNVEFINNTANGNGGAIIANTVNITKAIFYGNSANGNGNAIYVYDWENSTLIDSFLGLNYKNQTEIEKSNIISDKGTAVAPKWWLLLNIIKPDIIASDINNTFKLVFNQKTDGDTIISIGEIPALILVNLTESSNTIQSQAIGFFNFTTNQSANCIIHVINSYNGEEITNTIITVDNAPFSKLNDLISNNQSIILQKSYNYYQELDYKLANGIKITKNTTIDGAGYTLDAKNLANIFQVEKGVKLILKNINLANANIAIVNNGILDLTNVTSKAPIYNKGIITSGVKFIVYSNKVTTYDSYLVSLRTVDGTPILVSNLKYSDDQGHNYKAYIFTKGYYVNYVPEGITGHVTFNNVELNGFTNLTSKGSLDITKYPTVKTKVINIPVKEVVKSTVSKLTTVLKTNTLNLVNNFFKTVMR